MKKIFTAVIASMLLSACANSQHKMEPRLIGGPCEGCEAVLEYGDREMKSTDTLPGFDGPGERIKVSGTVYQSDGKTPAEDIILYIYHTNQEGLYAPGEDAKGWGAKHGYIRNWLKTDSDGRYTFYTLKPASYPNSSEAAHIHLTVLEPDGKYYWIGSYHFADDPLLSENKTDSRAHRGGSSGVLELKWEGDILSGKRDFVLGKNVPGYK